MFKNIVRGIALVLMIFFFVPMFTVSCGAMNETVAQKEVSAMNIVSGVKAQGEQITEPNYLVLIVILIPILILVFTFLAKAIGNQIAGILVSLASAGQLIAWIMIRSGVVKFAEDNFCQCKTGFLFWVNIGIIVLSIVGGVLMMLEDGGGSSSSNWQNELDAMNNNSEF